MSDTFGLKPLGRVHSSLKEPESAPKQEFEGAPTAEIEIFDDYAAGLEGVSEGDELLVLTWLHLAGREALRVHPRGDASRPATGVFSTRSPHRPNPLGLHRVRVTGAEPGRLHVAALEAVDGTPVVDIKPVISARDRARGEAPDIPEDAWLGLRDVGRDAGRRGLVSGFNGNLSIRQGDLVYVTASGSAKERLGREDLAVVDLRSGRRVSGGSPSSETPLHLAVYRSQPEAGAIVHTHPPHLLALSMLLEETSLLELPLYEAEVYRKSMTMIPAVEPGTDELARAVAEAAASHRAVLMLGHGLVCWGAGLFDALGLTEELENLARVQWLTLLRD